MSKVAKTLIVELLVLTTVAFAANKGPMNLQDPVDVFSPAIRETFNSRIAETMRGSLVWAF